MRFSRPCLELVTFLLVLVVQIYSQKYESLTPAEKALLRAAGRGHMRVVKSLIERGTDVNVKGKLGASPLIKAATNNKLGVVKVLVENGADVNQQDHYSNTALLWATGHGRTKVVEYLVSKGADVEIEGEKSATFTAIGLGHVEMAKILMKKQESDNQSFDVNTQDDVGNTALHMACQYGELEAVKLLVKLNADVNRKNILGTTPLMQAAYNGHLDVVEHLVKNGADVSVKNYIGWTAINWAKKWAKTSGRNNIVDYLKKQI